MSPPIALVPSAGTREENHNPFYHPRGRQSTVGSRALNVTNSNCQYCMIVVPRWYYNYPVTGLLRPRTEATTAERHCLRA